MQFHALASWIKVIALTLEAWGWVGYGRMGWGGAGWGGDTFPTIPFSEITCNAIGFLFRGT